MHPLSRSRAARRAGLEMALELGRRGRIELAVEIRLEARFSAGHGSLLSRSSQRALSAARARARRDMTVPMGQSITAAMAR